MFPLEMHARQFETVCTWLSRWFNVLSLENAVTRLKTGTLPERAACLTFDDGYADNFHVALPILKHHGLCATFFIATGFLDGGRMWNDSVIESVRQCQSPRLDLTPLDLGQYTLESLEDRRDAALALISRIKYQPLLKRAHLAESIAKFANVELQADLMLTSVEVKAMLDAGMQIGAHTMTHPILLRLSDEQARQEISGSKFHLEHLLGERVSMFAYPNGKPGEDYGQHHVDMVRQQGFDAAFSTKAGASKMGDDVFQIRRFTPWEPGRSRFGARLLANLLKGA